MTATILGILATVLPLIVAMLREHLVKTPTEKADAEYDDLDRLFVRAHKTRDYTAVALKLQQLHERAARHRATRLLPTPPQ